MDKFIIRYPEFSSVESARINIALDDASQQMSKKVWGKLYEQGLHALTAHMLYVSGVFTEGGLGSGQPIQTATSMSAGGLSTGYSAPDAGFGLNHEGFGSSTYGQAYLRLRRLVAQHILVVR